MRKENPSVFRAIMLLQFYSPVPVTQLKPQEGAGPGLLWHLGTSDWEPCRAGLPLLSEPGESEEHVLGRVVLEAQGSVYEGLS